MRFRTRVAFTLAGATLLGCGGDRVAGPSDEATRAAAALERAVDEMGLEADPSVVTYHTVAAALRGGVPVSRVEIRVDGDVQEWYAFAHEFRFEPATSSEPADLFADATFRSLIAWRPTDAGVHLIHLLASGREVGGPWPTEVVDGVGIEFPSTLMYSEGRNLFWDAVRGTQESDISEERGTPCPTPRRPAGPPAGATCVLATFAFGFSDVEAEPASFLFGPNGPIPSAATGTRRLSMEPQAVGGMLMTIDFRMLGQ